MGMTPEKMRQVLNSIGDSEKINVALRGEQGIGLLAFPLIAQELHLASSAEEGKPSSCLVLKRSWLKTGRAEVVERCRAHEHTHRGTVAYLEGILPEIAPQLTKARIKDYLGQQFASDLRANVYTMYISDDHDMEQIHSQRYRGVKVMSTNLPSGERLEWFRRALRFTLGDVRCQYRLVWPWRYTYLFAYRPRRFQNVTLDRPAFGRIHPLRQTEADGG